MEFADVDRDLVSQLRGCGASPTMGGDPEFFIADKDGKIMNADKFLPGKETPILVKSRHSDAMSKLFFDGIQAEIAVMHSTCREYFANNVASCLRSAYEKIPLDHHIILRPSAEISKDIIESAHPEARIFGCEPDYNAYTLAQNTPEMDASLHPYRYAGGHMHFGISSPYIGDDHAEYKLAKTEEGHIRAIKFFDLIVTIPTMLLDNGPDAIRRREKYGKAGCFRPTPYGIEYRTPSCWWLKAPMTVSLIYGLGRLAWAILTRGMEDKIRTAIGFSEEDIRGTIDESDGRTAKKIWENLRPYIALAGGRFSNPLSIGSVKTTDGGYVNEKYTGMAGTLPRLKGFPVFALAALEYAFEIGLDKVIQGSMRSEWAIDETSYRSGNGWVTGSYKNLIGNEDFKKFQASFLKAVFPKSKISYANYMGAEEVTS